MMKPLPLILLMLAALGGCAAPSPLPTHEWRGSGEATSLMSHRAAAITSASGTAALTLHSADGREVRLDAAFAAAPPRALRLRAWKLDRAVADWTLRDDGVWAWQADDAARPPVKGPWTAQHAEIWPLFFGMIDRKAGDILAEGPGPTFEVVRGAGDLMVSVTIDRATLTVRQCALRTMRNEPVQHARLDDYRMIGDIPWPMRIVATRGKESFTIEFDEVTLNEPLADEAFTPPARAKPVQ